MRRDSVDTPADVSISEVRNPITYSLLDNRIAVQIAAPGTLVTTLTTFDPGHWSRRNQHLPIAGEHVFSATLSGESPSRRSGADCASHLRVRSPNWPQVVFTIDLTHDTG